MKKFRNVVFITMLVLSLGVGSAWAGALTQGGTLLGRVIAVETFGAGSTATVIPSVNTSTAVYTLDASVNPATDFLVRYTLGGGALWGAALNSASCVYGGAGTATITLITGGTTADSTAVFRVTVGITPPIGGEAFTLTYKIWNAQTLATVGNVVTLQCEVYDLLAPLDTTQSVNAFTSGQGTTEVFAASNAAGGLFIDVATDRLNFGGASADVIGAAPFLTVNLGTITIADTGTAWTAAGDALWVANTAPAAVTNAIIVLTGAFSAGMTAPGKIWLDPLGAHGGPFAAVVTATTATFTLTGAQVAALIAAGHAHNIYYYADGATVIEETIPAAAMTINWTTATYTDDTATGTLRALANNGSTCFIYNIPSPDNTAAVAYLRIINDSAVAGSIRATLTLNDGTGPVPGVLIANLPAGQTVVLDSTQIAAALGAGTWPGQRARIVVNGEIPSMKCQAAVKSCIGGVCANTNFSTIAPQNNQN
jgi:hypothetical protein